MDSKKFKRNGAKLMNSKLVRCSSLGWFKEDGGIPEWLLIEVLIRLPVKFVFRFKIVSKEWLATISDQSFVRTYASRSDQHWALVTSTMLLNFNENFPNLEHGLLEELCGKPSLFVLPLPCSQQSEDSVRIYGVSNGLVLYGSCEIGQHYLEIVTRRHYICNPVTRQCIALPPLDSYGRIFGRGFLTQVEDGFLKSYRIVLKLPKSISGSSNILFQVYVSESGEWEEFIVPNNLKIPLPYMREAVTLNGILHWVAPNHGIIAYDPYQNPERIHIIAGNLRMRNDEDSLLVAYRGKLGYLEVSLSVISGNAFPNLRVWVLNDYGSDSGYWCLQHDISYGDIQYDANFPSRRSTFKPVCVHPFDSEIVYLGCDGVCVSYNMKTRKLQVEEEFFRHSGSMYKRMRGRWRSAFLLVVPPWPISIPNPCLGVMES